jgi:hypothetical protein
MPNVPIRIFDTSLALVSEVDAYEQAYFTRSLTGYGAFEIVINYNVVHAADFQKDYFVLFGTNIHRLGVIENISKEVSKDGKGSQKLTITGYEAKAIFNRRIVIPASGNSYYIQDAVQETAIKNTVYDQCGADSASSRGAISLITIAADLGRGVEYQLQAFNTILSDQLTTVAEASNPYMGFELYLDIDNKKLVLDMIVGLDRRASQSVNGRVCFSSGRDSLKSATISDQNSGYKNAVYVGGQGDGSDKTIVLVTPTSAVTGLLRREEYIDKSDLQTTEALTNAGQSELNAVAQAVLSIEAQGLVKSQYVLYSDYDLGDLVNIVEYDTSFDAQITEIEEEWENGNYDISLTFGKQAQSIASVLSSTTSLLDQTNTSKSGLGWKDKAISYAFSSSVSSITQAYTEILNDTIILGGSIYANCSLTLQQPDTSAYIGRKRYTIIIPAATLVSASGGPYTLTIKTASGAVVYVPIIKNGDTLLSGPLQFDVYVDASGNVSSEYWEVSGSNSLGTYVENSYGRGLLTETVSVTTGSSAIWNNFYEGNASFNLPLTYASLLAVSATAVNMGSAMMINYNSIGPSAGSIKVSTSNGSAAYTVLCSQTIRWRA